MKGESRDYDVNEWNKKIGSTFPLQIQIVMISCITGEYGKLLAKEPIELRETCTLLVGGILARCNDAGFILEGCNGEKLSGMVLVKTEGVPLSFNLKVVDEK